MGFSNKLSSLSPYTADKVEIGGMEIASIKDIGPNMVIFKSKEQAIRAS